MAMQKAELRLKEIAALVRGARTRLRYSQRELAHAVGIGERTLRRIERGAPVGLLPYDVLGGFLGLPRDWYLFPERYLDPAALLASREAAAARFLTSAEETGVLGTADLAMLADYLALHLQAGEPDRYAAATAAMHRSVLEALSAQRFAADHRRPPR